MVIGPFFFQGQTVNSSNYLEALAIPLHIHLQPIGFFQQNDTSPCLSLVVHVSG
jgi:hypothetical protein